MKDTPLIILIMIVLIIVMLWSIGDYEGWFEADPKKGEVWGDNPFNIQCVIVKDVKDNYVLYTYRNWISGNHTLKLSKFKRWYDKQLDKEKE